jgi:hypothetical protein
MRAVVDTNSLIRALIKPNGTVGPVLNRLAAGAHGGDCLAWIGGVLYCQLI